MTNVFLRLGGSNVMRWMASLAVACSFVLAAQAAAASPLGLSYIAYRLGGSGAAPIREGEFIHTGEKLLIKIRYMNQADAPAPAGAIVMTLPVGCAFVQSQEPDRLTVSVDGGREFGPLDRLQIRRNGAVRAAMAEDVTHIRLTLDHPVAPGESGEINIVAAQE